MENTILLKYLKNWMKIGYIDLKIIFYGLSRLCRILKVAKTSKLFEQHCLCLYLAKFLDISAESSFRVKKKLEAT